MNKRIYLISGENDNDYIANWIYGTENNAKKFLQENSRKDMKYKCLPVSDKALKIVINEYIGFSLIKETKNIVEIIIENNLKNDYPIAYNHLKFKLKETIKYGIFIQGLFNWIRCIKLYLYVR